MCTLRAIRAQTYFFLVLHWFHFWKKSMLLMKYALFLYKQLHWIDFIYKIYWIRNGIIWNFNANSSWTMISWMVNCINSMWMLNDYFFSVDSSLCDIEWLMGETKQNKKPNLVTKIDFCCSKNSEFSQNHKNQPNQRLPCKWITMPSWQCAMWNAESSGILVINQAKCIMLISAVLDFECINAILTMRDTVLKCDHLFNFIVNGFAWIQTAAKRERQAKRREKKLCFRSDRL